ncbi:aminoglycoside phosphotransferase family protein [Micromonospora sp. WMMD975]|uniref:phosphotransferase enzyme family protein n=1 Tax=Micromonospora sp. WMMD975 TaxID=3016087 RepID=UPI00249AEBB6|nr:aminoglycoside phosphotransferase family protein [Micromonospora sp. WMMD975]WFE36210.1 aminoglycoside phosphotransferase family protein [Micromonospora sp. WMMD975]
MATTDAVAAARSVASSLGLPSRDAIILQDSNRTTLRLLPSDVVARVSPAADHGAARFELDIARRLTAEGSPVAVPDPRVRPRVHEHDGYAVTLWSYYEPSTRTIPPPDYARALLRLHAGMRDLRLPTPHYTDRVEQAQRLVADRDRTPDLVDADREFLDATLRRLRRAVAERGRVEQILHGEPHPGNLVSTGTGPLFIDLETCCRGPVEFDLAHAPEEVAEHYPDVDHDLLRACRTLTLTMVTTWRWDRHDRLPAGRRLAAEWLRQIRAHD